MNDLSQKTQAAFKSAAQFSTEESYNTLTLILIAVVILIIVYVLSCILSGLGDDSVKLKDVPSLLVRGVLLIIFVTLFFYF